MTNNPLLEPGTHDHRKYWSDRWAAWVVATGAGSAQDPTDATLASELHAYETGTPDQRAEYDLIEVEMGLADLIEYLDFEFGNWREFVMNDAGLQSSFTPDPDRSAFSALHALCDANMLLGDKVIELISNDPTQEHGLKIANGIIAAFDRAFSLESDTTKKG